jgi:hypothetical protein
MAIFICLVFFFLSTQGRELLYGGKIIKEWDALTNKDGIASSSIKISTIEIAPALRMVVSQLGFGFYSMFIYLSQKHLS